MSGLPDASLTISQLVFVAAHQLVGFEKLWFYNTYYGYGRIKVPQANVYYIKKFYVLCFKPGMSVAEFKRQ